MAFVTNEHVERLWQYQPFHPNFSQLFAEFVDTRQSDQLDTKALTFVSKLVLLDKTRMVVLTGDPGHGKTHLCGQLVRPLIGSGEDVRKVLRDWGDGSNPVAKLASGKNLHIIKDLSELTPDVASGRLDIALTEEGRVTVVCANEGRLRDVVSGDHAGLKSIQFALEHVLKTGQTTPDEVIWVINLNHQSVAAEGGKSLALQALRNWVQDLRKWNSCDRCDAKSQCPIYENHRLLSSQDATGQSRRTAWEALLRVAEKNDHVVTIRELLVFLAHTVTGGLRCPDVHELVQRWQKRNNWQYKYLFSEATFGELLEPRVRERLAVFRAMGLLDPGRRAIRPVDDHLDLEVNDREGRFIPPAGDGTMSAKSKDQQKAAARVQQNLYRFLRRRDYFVALSGEGPQVSPSERLGFSHYAEFEKLLRPGVLETDTVEIRNTVLCGFEAVQGVRRPANRGSFAIIDPAFSSHRGNASVVAVQISKMKVRLLPQTSWWRETSGQEPDIADAVDWVDRRVHVVIPDVDGNAHSIDLDCRQFEVVCRAARGLVSRAFFQADIRRIAAQLAAVGANAPRLDEITVIVNGKPATLVIDVGDVIVATRS